MRSSNFFFTSALVLLLTACGDDGSTGSTAGGGSTSTSDGGSGNTGGNGAGSSDGGATSTGFMQGGGDTGGGDTGGSCAGTTTVAEPIPLDLYIMLDGSGSMTERTGMMGQGVEKWDAITSAIDTFLDAPESAGIGVGLQFFPLRANGAPDTCDSQADCGAFGPCFLRVCQDNTGIVCVSNADCPGTTGPCVDIGQCANNPQTLCIPIGAQCNGNAGTCTDLQESVCLNVDSCETTDYATPAVPIGALPGNYAALDGAIDARVPEGATPTSAALTGAIDYASSYAAANPDHVVVTVLATDGIPTKCDPLDADGISAIAAAGVASSPSIRTFVIGILAGDDQDAQNLMNDVAEAGGTENAFLIDPQSQNVEAAFLAALDEIRGSALACEFLVPQPTPPDTIDFGQVNVDYTPSGANDPTTIGYVGNVGACDASSGGWYYDVDPASGTPTRIIVCPSTCTQFQTGGSVNIRVGCETVVAVPR